MKQERITLVRPIAAHKEAALVFKQSFFDAGENVIDGSERLDLMDSFEDWLIFVTRNANGENGIVTDTYFAVDSDGKIVGIIDFRHELNEFFKDFGHCGYSVAPRARKKGYATEMLGKIVRQARDDGLAKLQLAALRSNIPSVRTIEKNGGRVVRTFDFYGQPADVFEIDLS